MRELAFRDGVMYFPITAFDADGNVDGDATATVIADRMAYDPAGVFAACGTGEYHALSATEYGVIVSAAVAAVAGAAPVLGGAGGPLGHARECIAAGDAAGLDGYLLMPPYLMTASTDGIVAYVQDLARHTDRPLIVYHRATSRLSVDAVARLLELPNVIGIKDGVGDVAQMHQFVRVAAAANSKIMFFNGLPTAELSQASYRAIGVDRYSSAAFAILPALANACYRALADGDTATETRLIDGFFSPFVQLRDTVPGFAVTLIKAATRLQGFDVGIVRPPLVEPNAAQLDRLAQIVAAGQQLLG